MSTRSHGVRAVPAIITVITLGCGSVVLGTARAGNGRNEPHPGRSQPTLDAAGILDSTSANRFESGSTRGFFARLGSNGRSCNTCHVEANGWTFTPQHARSLARNDPLFSPNDGSDCPARGRSQGPDSARSSEVLRYGLIRVEMGIPSGANFALVTATNPKDCAIEPGSSAADGQLFLFRRPLPSTNLIFNSAIMWDGRETLQSLTTHAGFQDTGPLLLDLADQANGAVTGHAQGESIAGTRAQSDIVSFEAALYTSQILLLQPAQRLFAGLGAHGAHGGPDYLQNTVAPAFFIGMNDPLKPGFTSNVFTIFAAWEPTSPQYVFLSPGERAIGRGEALFNTRPLRSTTSPGSTVSRAIPFIIRVIPSRDRTSPVDVRSAITTRTWGITPPRYR